jgi:acetyltransferase-like isoleucine patch superfamily enzyme
MFIKYSKILSILDCWKFFQTQEIRFLHNDSQIDWIKSLIMTIKYHLLHSKKIYVSNGVLISNPQTIEAKTKFRVGLNDFSLASKKEKTSIILRKTSKFFVDDNVSIGRGCRIALAEKALFSIGRNSYITGLSNIVCTKKISIGEHCAISWGVLILDSDFHTIGSSNSLTDTGIVIGNHVLIGANSTILKNVTIGDNCIIGANSVVRQSVPAGCMVIGNPAVIVRENVVWD